MDPGMELLTTLGEVGGITGMMLAVVAFAIRLAKKNGCRMKCYNCNGQPLAEVDVEEGGAALAAVRVLEVPSLRAALLVGVEAVAG